MTLEELKLEPAYLTLNSDQMKRWIIAYCSNGGDAMDAAAVAYNSPPAASRATIANRNKRHPAIKKLINAFFGQVDETGTRDEFLALLWRRVISPSGDDKTQLGWATLYMKVKGYETKAAPEAPKTEEPEADQSIDDLVREMEAKGAL